MPCTVQTFAVVKHQRFHPFGDRIRLCIHFFPLSVNSISSFPILSSLDSILTGFYPRFLSIKKSYFSLTAQDSLTIFRQPLSKIRQIIYVTSFNYAQPLKPISVN